MAQRIETLKPKPIDEIQRNEIFAEQCSNLQELYDQGVAMDEIDLLANKIDISRLIESNVVVNGGEIETFTINSEGDGQKSFIPNDEPLAGQYLGLIWRKNFINLPNNETELFYRLCHIIGDGTKFQFTDDDNCLVTRQPRDFITADNSLISSNNPSGFHDLRNLINDGFSVDLDSVVLEDKMSLQDKADRIAKMFRSENSDFSAKERNLRDQRVSYLNSLGLFSSVYVSSAYGIIRTSDMTGLTYLGDKYVEANYVMFENDIDEQNNELIDTTEVLSYEFEDDESTLSIPHIPGVTKVIPMIEVEYYF